MNCSDLWMEIGGVWAKLAKSHRGSREWERPVEGVAGRGGSGEDIPTGLRLAPSAMSKRDEPARPRPMRERSHAPIRSARLIPLFERRGRGPALSPSHSFDISAKRMCPFRQTPLRLTPISARAMRICPALHRGDGAHIEAPLTRPASAPSSNKSFPCSYQHAPYIGIRP